jgi:poly(A) polymerase
MEGKKRVLRLKPENLLKFTNDYPPQLWQSLLRVADRSDRQLYLVGGTVRDCLLGRVSHDLDIAVSGQVFTCAKMLLGELGGGTIVDLSGPEDEACRVVWQKEQVDLSAFRTGAKTIEEDLRLRDFTINSMAVELGELVGENPSCRIIDPTGGMTDLQTGRVRFCPGAFVADSVRMLRGFRLCATLGFHLTKETVEAVKKHASLINNVAAERIAYELAMIFDSPRTTGTIRQMDEVGLLAYLLPELYRGKGVEQPVFHHLDVFEHCFLALAKMEDILADPDRFFPGQGERIASYLKRENVVRCLKWAALMHDIGKPATRELRADKGGRVTFYGHDEVGRDLFNRFADRLKWSKVDAETTGGLIGMHMHPFHLCNVQREEGVTRRAALKLCHRAEHDLAGLFLLAMSDSLASSGEQKPERMEEELVNLFEIVHKIYDNNIKPVLDGPRLVTGKDLIDSFGLVPGPLFSEILDELEIARVEGLVRDRQEGLDWVNMFLQERDRDGRESA